MPSLHSCAPSVYSLRLEGRLIPHLVQLLVAPSISGLCYMTHISASVFACPHLPCLLSLRQLLNLGSTQVFQDHFMSNAYFNYSCTDPFPTYGHIYKFQGTYFLGVHHSILCNPHVFKGYSIILPRKVVSNNRHQAFNYKSDLILASLFKN